MPSATGQKYDDLVEAPSRECFDRVIMIKTIAKK